MPSKKYAAFVYFLVFAVASPLQFVLSSSSSSPTYRPLPNSFLYDLRLQCPNLISSSSSPIQMVGESLNRALSPRQMNVNTVILFYASWCPFSSNVQPKFATLSSIFPQIKHIMVEQSSALPSILSRYGIHSVPSILMVNQTGRVRYRGPKDLRSLVRFYKRTAGFDPVVDMTKDQISDFENSQRVLQFRNRTSPKDILMREPCLVLSILFLFMKAFLYVLPRVASYLTALWVSHVPHLNLGIFGESKQLLGRALHVIDVKRVFSKLRHYKSRNFNNGVRSAQVWASSLASVSLGETSSSRASHGGPM